MTLDHPLEVKLNDNKFIKIIAESYWASVCLFKDGIIYSKKNHYYQNKSHHDCYASDSFIAFANLPPNKVKIRSGENFLSLEGPCVLYQPPFSLLETHTEEGELTWECIAFTTFKFPLIQEPRILIQSAEKIPKSKAEVINLLNKMTHATVIRQETKPSAIAERLKNYIDKNFCENLKISHLEETLGCSRVIMTRAFSKTYNISPVEYRHRLRVHQALSKMRNGLSITAALYDVGFSDPSQFIFHFKKILGTTPNQYKIMSKI